VSATKKAKKVGRPKLPKGHAKGQTIRMRVTDDEAKRFNKAAQASGQTLSHWMRSTLKAAAEK
jgi:uncharacterized protein (DUF1778 family)